MAVIHSLKKKKKKTPTTKTLQDLQELFLQKIDHLLLGFDEGHVVFDKYDEKSLINKTREKRAKSQKLHANMKLSMSIKELLSSTKTKRQLTIYFAEHLINERPNLVVGG